MKQHTTPDNNCTRHYTLTIKVLIIVKETTHYTNNKSVNNRKRHHTTPTIKVLIIEKDNTLHQQ